MTGIATIWAQELFESEIHPTGDTARVPDENHQRFAASYHLGSYTADWDLISDRTRQESQYRCQKCGVDLTQRKHLLHVHHLDFNKLNNESYNLLVVCILCHSAYPGHRIVLTNLRREDYMYIKVQRALHGA